MLVKEPLNGGSKLQRSRIISVDFMAAITFPFPVHHYFKQESLKARAQPLSFVCHIALYFRAIRRWFCHWGLWWSRADPYNNPAIEGNTHFPDDSMSVAFSRSHSLALGLTGLHPNRKSQWFCILPVGARQGSTCAQNSLVSTLLREEG